MKHKVVFLDRDGTLLHDRPGFYLLRPERLRLYRHTPRALKLLREAGYRLVVVTNQSGIGRCWLDFATLRSIHARMRQSLKKHGAKIDAVYFCPHAPDDRCRCRKPSDLLARRALRELGLTLEGAAVIGDKKTDVDMARRLGVPSIHLRTGHGRNERRKYGRTLRPTHSASNLLTGVRWFLKRGG